MSERDHAVDTRAGIGSDAWIDALANGTPAPYGIDEAVRLSKAMEMAYGNVL